MEEGGRLWRGGRAKVEVINAWENDDDRARVDGHLNGFPFTFYSQIDHPRSAPQ